jgi:deoxyribodipyrimidine photo-lyase
LRNTVETAAAAKPALRDAAEKYLAELGWREFATALLDAHPDLATRPLRPESERFPWRRDERDFRAWARGETGYPIVDAGMRQLWRTLDSGAKRNGVKRSGFECPFQARQSRLGMAS